jgi:hypothetical protein
MGSLVFKKADGKSVTHCFRRFPAAGFCFVGSLRRHGSKILSFYIGRRTFHIGPSPSLRDYDRDNFTPGYFLAAGVFPAENEINLFPAVAFVKFEYEWRVHVKGGVEQFINRLRRRGEDGPTGFYAMLIFKLRFRVSYALSEKNE